MNIRSFLSTQPVGLILRVFANKSEHMEARGSDMRAIVTAALAQTIEGIDVFNRIDIVAWADPRFEGSDRGQTADVLSNAFSAHERVHVSEFTNGDLFCALLNWAVTHQMSHGITHSMIASYQALDHMNESNLRALVEAFLKGAKVAGVALSEMTELICHGRLTNTFALWKNDALMSVSGFDPIAQKYADPNMTRYLRSWLPETQEFVSYDRAGVEEVIPLARMVEVFGQCIAPIMPADEKARYHVPDKDKEPENWARHRRKMETKKIRQDAHLSQAGFAPNFLMGGVMQDYRTF